ncbi:hypothetical protein, partial [Serratia marcescens]|uniref:hypothetical protein n=1 Tax=Serratia marcescens TaxID=615 RepID=UPI001952F0F9
VSLSSIALAMGSGQEDLYQVSELMKFVLPWGVGWAIAGVFGVVATAVCVVGAFLGRPVTLE